MVKVTADESFPRLPGVDNNIGSLRQQSEDALLYAPGGTAREFLGTFQKLGSPGS